MNEPRAFHGLSKMAQRIFAFGTCGDMDNPMPSAEVYDVVKNSWKKLPDMPKAGSWITCVRVQNQILISSNDFRLVSYDIGNEAYSYVGKQNNRFLGSCIASSKEKLYLQEEDMLFEMTMQYEVLNTIPWDKEKTWIESNTNAAGMIFMLKEDG